jgi:hypothetical protein
MMEIDLMKNGGGPRGTAVIKVKAGRKVDEGQGRLEQVEGLFQAETIKDKHTTRLE